MKSIITTITGGMPFQSDSIELLQSNVQEITSNICKGLAIGNTAFILSGCVATVNNPGTPTPTLDLTAGAIWYADEIYLVDTVTSQSLPSGTTQNDVDGAYEWDLAQTTDRNVVFKDLVAHDIHKHRKAVLVASGSSWSGLSALPTLSELFKTQITGSNIVTEKSAELGIGGYYSISGYGGNYSNDESVGSLTMNATIAVASGIPSPILTIRVQLNSIFTLPLGHYIPIVGTVNAVPTQMYMNVVSVTPSKVDIKLSDGTSFNASDVVNIYYSGSVVN